MRQGALDGSVAGKQKKLNRKTRKPHGKTTFLLVRAGLINLIGTADQRTFMIRLVDLRFTVTALFSFLLVICLGVYSRNEIAGSCNNFLFNILRNLQLLHSSCLVLHSH